MKFLKILTVFLLVCILAVPAFAAPKQTKSTIRMKKLAEPMVDSILKGLALDDFLTYSNDFSENLKALGARTKFFQVSRNIKRNLGNYVDRKFMGMINKQDMVLLLWKAKFDQTKNDILIKLVLSKENNRYVISGLWFQ